MKRAVLLLLLLGLPTTASAAEGNDRRDTAWSRSVAAESAGDYAGAEEILVEAWGDDSSNYFVQLRRAHLALRRGRFAQAEARYAALQATPEGATDPEVAAGLRAARTRTLPAPVAAASDSLARVTPEIWGGVAGRTLGRTRHLGGAIFARLPVRLTPELNLHLAGRYVSYGRQSGASPWAFGQSPAGRVNLGDVFLGAELEREAWSVAALGVYEKITGTSALAGGGLHGRVGHRYGISMDAALLLSAEASANWQIVPLAFFWPVPNLGLRAGARLTFDGRRSTSAMAGASFSLRGHSLHVDGHLGNERAALNAATFSLLDLSADASLGGTITLLLRLSPTVRLLAQTQGEHLRSEGAEGAYWSVSLGFDMAVGSL